MTDQFRWGILGTGWIATKFATGVKALPDAQLTAVGSRSQAGADRFGDQYSIPRRHASYADLAHDPEVDAIYVATPHTQHCENTLLCLDAGKPVICEKPFAINAREVGEMIERARQKRVFLMEAMWTRYLPAIVRLRDMIAAGIIGEIRMVTADFGFRTAVNPQGRLFDLKLGGGALMDVGIYPLSFASMLLGRPSQAQGAAQIGETGADEQSAYLLSYPGGQLALLSSAIRTQTLHEAIIAGTDGLIRVPDFWHAARLILSIPGKADEMIEVPFEANGYNYEAAEVMRCVRAGKLESAIMPLDELLAIMQTMDSLRAPWGLKYAADV